MQLRNEIDKIFTRLKAGHLDPEVASQAVEQLISAHVRKPPSQLDGSIRSAVARMRMRAADYIAIEAEVMAWMCLRAEPEEQAVLWV